MDKKPVIAIVDDDQSAREGIVDLVSSMGFEARAFERAEDFLRSQLLAPTVSLQMCGCPA